MKVIEELKKMNDERFLGIYEALEDQGFGPLDGEVAKVMKFRPHAIRKLPMAQRAKRARSILTSGSKADLTYELFGRPDEEVSLPRDRLSRRDGSRTPGRHDRGHR